MRFISKKKRRDYEELILKDILDDLKKKHLAMNQENKGEEIKRLKQKIVDLERGDYER